jgi:AcrR family transcriptional regulator
MDTKDRIVASAIEVFAARGKFGARMEEIAERARVNKAMLYYYYSSKENLYRESLRTIISRNFTEVFQTFLREAARDGKPEDLIETLSRTYYRVFSRRPTFTRILIEAVANEPGEAQKILRSLKEESDLIHPERVLALFKSRIARGEYRNVDPRQVLVSIIGMNLIYFLARPIAEVLLELDVEDEKAFQKKREESVIDLLLHGIMRKRGRHEKKKGGS